MKKTPLVAAIFLIILIWISIAHPAVINKIRSIVIDFMEFPLKIAARSAKGLYSLATFKNRYEQKIADLEKRVAILLKTNIEMKDLLEENERLRKLLLFKTRFSSRSIPAEIIARDQSNWSTFIIIDKGRRDGVVSNMSVAKEEGLIGRVVEVGESTAKVMLIDNPNSKLAAVVQRTREQGILVGIGRGLCKLTYLAYDTQVKPGDIVIQSELSSLSTKGILIGEVIKVVKGIRSLYASAIVKPACNLFKIEEVLCIE